MGVKFTCALCGRSLNVKDSLAGKRGFCPHCKGRIEIPAVSEPAPSSAPAAAASAASQSASQVEPTAAPLTAASHVAKSPAEAATGNPTSAVPATAAVAQAAVSSAVSAATVNPSGVALGVPAAAELHDPIQEAPHLQWYVLPPGASSQYGPADAVTMRSWIQQGRVGADAMIWRQDWPEWKFAGTVFPQLGTPSVGGVRNTFGGPGGNVSIPTAASALPTAAAILPAAAGVLPAAAGMLPAAAAVVLPTAAGMLPAAVGVLNAGMGAIPHAGAPTAGIPIAGAPVVAGIFPGAASPTARYGASGRPYRKPSKTGALVAIGILLVAILALIPFVVKVVLDM